MGDPNEQAAAADKTPAIRGAAFGPEGRTIPAPPDVPGGLQAHQRTVYRVTLNLLLPAEPDALLESPDAVAANAIDDRMPYWAFAWDAAEPLIAALPDLVGDLPSGSHVVEIGCGLGLVAMAAAIARPDLTIEASDHDAMAIELLATNAAANGLGNLSTCVRDWATPDAATFVLASDVLYETRFHSVLLSRFGQELSAGTQAVWISDPGRATSAVFFEQAARSGLVVDVFAADRQPVDGGFRTGCTQLVRLMRSR